MVIPIIEQEAICPDEFCLYSSSWTECIEEVCPRGLWATSKYLKCGTYLEIENKKGAQKC